MLPDRIKRFFLITPTQLSRHDQTTFQKSALRILLAAALVVYGLITGFSSWEAIMAGKLHVIAFNLFFLICLSVLLVRSVRSYMNAASGFLILIGLSGVSVVALLNDLQVAKFGLILLYVLPLITRLFFSLRATFIVMGANLVTLSFVLFGHSSALLPEWDISLPHTETYLQLLLFIAFNVALPLAVSRAFFTLEANAKHMESLYQKLNRNAALYEEIFEHTGTATLLCNRNGKLLKANQDARQLLSVSESEVENTSITQWLSPLGESSGRYFWQSNTTECQLLSDANVHIELHRSSLTSHGYYVMHLQNITHLKAMRKVLAHTQETNSRLSKYDNLTQLPNHLYFCQEVDERGIQSTNYRTAAMFIVRICQFKLLNKQYGQEKANRVILSFAKQLQSNLSDQTIIGRLRGVKFACFIPLGQTHLIQRNLSALIRSVLPEQLKVNGTLLNMEYQVGVAYYPTDGMNSEELLEHCEMALEYSTSADRLSYYDAALETKLREEHQLGMQLSEAIKRNEIHLWLQPQVSPNGHIRSFEALARWQTEDGNFVSPLVFIRLAETLGLLPQLAENLLRELVATLSVWHEEHVRTPVAINLAGQELMNDAFFALLLSLSADHPWLNQMLELEITETSSVMTHPIIHKRLRTLSQYGFSIAIDDFGTGQASLGQLVDIPATILKIDRRFIAPLPKDTRHLDIVKSTIKLASSLKMRVIAEGIENKEQADLLISLGCDTLQGYYYGKPTPIRVWTDNDHAKAKELRMVF